MTDYQLIHILKKKKFGGIKPTKNETRLAFVLLFVAPTTIGCVAMLLETTKFLFLIGLLWITYGLYGWHTSRIWKIGTKHGDGYFTVNKNRVRWNAIFYLVLGIFMFLISFKL